MARFFFLCVFFSLPFDKIASAGVTERVPFQAVFGERQVINF